MNDRPPARPMSHMNRAPTNEKSVSSRQGSYSQFAPKPTLKAPPWEQDEDTEE